jgi:PAS domain S-box-containing protein
MSLLKVADSWEKLAMTVLVKTVSATRPGKSQAAPALFRLLSDSALSRAALGACGVPVALLDANAKTRSFTYVNAAFESFFGYSESEALARPAAALLFHGDEALLQRLLAESPRRWQLTAWGKDGEVRHVEVALCGLRSADGRLTHWVVAFSDRAEVEQLRAQLEALKSASAASASVASLSLRLDPVGQPARGAQKAGVEIPAADELNPNRQAAGILHQR